MKNTILTSGIALAAALSLVGCSKEPDVAAVPDGAPFEVSTLITKTANDGIHTTWAADDAISLYHAVSGSADYKSDGEFKVDAALSGKFSGTLSESLAPAGTYDWYALYPYTADALTPASSAAGGITVGGLTQTQTGNGSSAHLSGEACPLYGIAKAVRASTTPSLEMKNLSSVIRVNVTNNGTSPLTVKSVSFTSSEDIVGTYYVDYTGGVPAYVKTSDSEVSNTATLRVKNGEEIAVGKSAQFYIAIKPHIAPAGTVLKLRVNGTENSYTLTSARTFAAGKMASASISVKGYALLDIVENGVLFWISGDGKTGKVLAGPRGEGKAYCTDKTTATGDGGTQAAIDRENGRVNVAVLKSVDASLDKFPAAQYCETMAPAGEWYLPAIEELTAIFKAYNGTTIDGATVDNPGKISAEEKAARALFDAAVLSLPGGVVLNAKDESTAGDSAFSSTETSLDKAYYVRFGKALCDKAAKNGTARTARCIKVVNLK